MKNILFIGTTHMNIYMDVIAEMQRQGYSVDFIPEKTQLDDPDNVRGYAGISRRLRVHPKTFRKKNEQYWRDILADDKYNRIYDILFVLDGQSVSPCVFDILRERNPKLYAVNYLFDTVKCVYHFERNFNKFDKVATFDIAESKQYGIGHLPIFWVESDCNVNLQYKTFGLGRIDMKRYKIFKFFDQLASQFDIPSYIKLQVDRYSFFMLKYFIRKLFGCVVLTPEVYYSDLCCQMSLSPSDFRKKIMESEIVIDTAPNNQDGLTARFMWALGAKRKIITTNEHVLKYPFYSPQQILVVNADDIEKNKPYVISFMEKALQIPSDKLEEIDKCRIDHWLEALLPASE